MFKKVKVVMLPTNEKEINPLYFFHNVLRTASGKTLNENYIKDGTFKFQNLYFLSDEEIKEGDWYIYYQGEKPEIRQDKNDAHGICSCKKIIGTTDKTIGYSFKVNHGASITTGFQCLPQPSQSFVEKFVEEYNKGNIITEVMVEYEESEKKNILGLEIYNSLKPNILKVNPKDNTITIKKVKDSWTREEILKALNNPYGQGSVSRDEYRTRVMSELDLD